MVVGPRHGCVPWDHNIIIIYVTVKFPFHVKILRVEVYYDLGGVAVPHEETVSTGRENGMLNSRRSGY